MQRKAQLITRLIVSANNNLKRFSSSSYTTFEEKDGVRHITLNHPKTRNSLSMDMMSDLLDKITKGQDDPHLRCILLSSTGPVFSAGHNLKELTADHKVDDHAKIFSKASELMLSIVRSPVPVIAKVNGLAAAAGCQLIATCDITVCSDKSTFSTPGANFGIFCSTPGIAVARCVQRKTALHMLLTGLPLTAQEALVAGLVSKVVPEELLDEEINKITSSIISKSRPIIESGKRFFYEQANMSLEEAYKLGTNVMVSNVNSNDGKEGINSFVEKRKPTWSHVK
uniref:Enoyl-CoA hydratase domain-containing protein 3, mitochondrial n=1 Tax=Xenopsylla cheopis TaxID=163159 RepID=A0A6M2DNW5_XENCH